MSFVTEALVTDLNSTNQHSYLSSSSANDSSSLSNTTAVAVDCIILQFEEYIPWNNPHNIVSFETEDLVHALKDLVFLPVLFLIGCPANLINMMVFYKQGLKERVNVCLFALSLADEVYLINNMLWYGDQLYFRFTTKEKLGPVLTFLLNNYLLGFHGFIWVSQVLTAIISADRCFCVLQPLRSQSALSATKMTIIIIAVHIVILGLVSFELVRYRVACALHPNSSDPIKTTVASELYHRYPKLFEYLDIFVLGLGLPGLVIVVVLSTTMVTVVQLRQAALWRAGTSSSIGLTEREIALTKMLVGNSVFFMVCVIPFTVFRLFFLLMPEMNTGGRRHNFFLMMQWILIIISYFNATFNFVVYYTMGSRFRQTFWQLFTTRSHNIK